MKLIKMSGAGNTFIFANLIPPDSLEQLQAYSGTNELSKISQFLCTQSALSPADGAVFVDSSQIAQLKWLFFNSDGSKAEMCGNAARCMGRFARDQKIADSKVTFESLAAIIEAEVLDDEGTVSVVMPPIKILEQNGVIDFLSQSYHYTLVDSGVPHCVISVKKLQLEGPLKELARHLRQKEFFPPKGANITFYEVQSDKKIRSVSYERGVEDFTQACGTGAVAAAFCHHEKLSAGHQIEVSVPGGELTVVLSKRNPLLIGPTEYLSEIEVPNGNE